MSVLRTNFICNIYVAYFGFTNYTKHPQPHRISSHKRRPSNKRRAALLYALHFQMQLLLETCPLFNSN